MWFLLGTHPYGKAAWPCTLEEVEIYRKLASEWKTPESIHTKVFVPAGVLHYHLILYLYLTGSKTFTVKIESECLAVLHRFCMVYSEVPNFSEPNPELLSQTNQQNKSVSSSALVSQDLTLGDCSSTSYKVTDILFFYRYNDVCGLLCSEIFN